MFKNSPTRFSITGCFHYSTHRFAPWPILIFDTLIFWSCWYAIKFYLIYEVMKRTFQLYLFPTELFQFSKDPCVCVCVWVCVCVCVLGDDSWGKVGQFSLSLTHLINARRVIVKTTVCRKTSWEKIKRFQHSTVC